MKISSPTRSDLEQAANAFFADLVTDVHAPRQLDRDMYDAEVSLQIEETQREVGRLDDIVTGNAFTAETEHLAHSMVARVGLKLGEIDHGLQLLAKQFVVRAQRQGMLYFLHTLRSPYEPYVSDDHLFKPETAREGSGAQTGAAATIIRPDVTLERAVIIFKEYQQQKGLGSSAREETARVLRWLQEEIEPATALSVISRDQVRDFRDKLLRLRGGVQGRKLPFRERLSDNVDDRLKFVTMERYWRFIHGFLDYFDAEYDIANVATNLRFEGGKNELRASPIAFSRDELRLLLKTPLYAGYKSSDRLGDVGDYFKRDGHWWSAIILMHTGLRAGDLAQLLPSDFRLDDETPHILIQPGMLPEGVAKRSKFGPRTHAVPLLPVLFELGLREFVEHRSKRYPKERVFREIALGAYRRSMGMTKFWSPYLKKHGLHANGRATHVWRHTVASRLRDVKVSNEDIGAVLGHQGGSTTAGYGGPQGLQAMLVTLLKLDHSVDMVEVLGAFDAKKHLC